MVKKVVHRLGELFCGPGGIGIGAIGVKAGSSHEVHLIEHAWATDYHADTCETYQRNIFPNKPERVVCGDIRTLDFDDMKKLSDIDALAFGFPCNDFSQVGEQKGVQGTFGPLYTYAAKALRHFRPKWFLAENVSGLKSANEGGAFVEILKEFKDCGYTLYPNLYKFEDYGVPQARHRIIIIGIRKDLNIEFRVPKPTGVRKSASMALSGIPVDAPNQELTRQSDTVVARLKHILPGQNAFTATLPKHLRLNVKGAKISQIYKRLDPNKPAYTVTGSGGGGTHIYHWDEPRALTNRERARLQTFPDTFEFYGTKESVRRQIGMAVPPEGVRHIFEAILKSFVSEDYPSVQPTFEVLDASESDLEGRGIQQRLLEEVRTYGKELA